MEMSFGTDERSRGFDGIVLPGSRSGSRRRAWCLPWVLPELMGHHLDFPATNMCAVSRSQECGLWYDTRSSRDPTVPPVGPWMLGGLA